MLPFDRYMGIFLVYLVRLTCFCVLLISQLMFLGYISLEPRKVQCFRAPCSLTKSVSAYLSQSTTRL